LTQSGDVAREFDEVQSPNENVGLLRVSGVFPTFSSDGKKLAFVDNEFKKVWVADSEKGLRPICTVFYPKIMFSSICTAIRF